MDNRKIGVFDSGLGGLTVVRAMEELLPAESIVYFGDIARLPYGSKSKETITEFSHQIMRFLLQHDVKAVIVACGTASSNALEELQSTYDLPIMGVVEPGARAAAKATHSGRVGVTGTEATIRSGAYERLLQLEDKQTEVYAKACPLFVPLVEEGWFDDSITAQVITRYLAEIKENQVDTLVLGCTHYPLLRTLIQKEMGENVTLINPSRAVVEELRAYLQENQMQSSTQQGQYEFYVSDSTDKFQAFGRKVLEIPSLTVQKVNIEKY
ncbi:MAG: glutamate racemase [Lachnospiraceae bacterium]|jgi:glutamate racemase|nr:glutamate racemase [Lachnospiraceae bacterium]